MPCPVFPQGRSVIDVADVVLAAPATALPSGWAFEPKWDGWRGVLSIRRLMSRHGKDLSRLFPELLGMLPEGTILDGEIVCWAEGRLDFAALHRRRSASTAVCFVAFDVPEHAGRSVRPLPYRQRRVLLTSLTLKPPLHVVESTTDQATALRWWEDYRAVGIRGPGRGTARRRLPTRPTRLAEAAAPQHRGLRRVIGVTGIPSAPKALLLGRQDGERMRATAVSIALPRTLAQEIGGQVEPLGDQPVPLAFGLPEQEPLLHVPVAPTLTGCLHGAGCCRNC